MKPSLKWLVMCVVGGAGLLAVGQAELRQPKKPCNAETRQLLVVNAGQRDGTFSITVGDVVEIQPFGVPFVPTYFGSSLAVEIKGGDGLPMIGQLEQPVVEGEGGGYHSAFLLGREKGKYTVSATLKSRDGNPISDYNAKFTVNVEAAPVRRERDQ